MNHLMNAPKVEVNINDIVPGDTIIHNGELRTVCACDIKSDSFMGTTIFGDSYAMGRKSVTKVLLRK